MNLSTKALRRLRDYGGAVGAFCRTQDFTLAGVWQALSHAPTFSLAGGAELRPLTCGLLVRRTDGPAGETFDVVRATDLLDAPVVSYKPEPSWATTSA
jgi:hypothetical protein